MPSLPALSLLVLEYMCVLIIFSLAFFSLRFSGFSVYRELRESTAWEWRENDQFPLSDEMTVHLKEGFLQQHTTGTERGQLCLCSRILSVKGKTRLCSQTQGFLHLELIPGRFSLSESQVFWLANCREPQHRPPPKDLYEDKTQEILRSIPVTS